MLIAKVRVGRRKHCSLKCSRKASRKRVEFACSTCGKVVKRTKYKAQHSKSGLYFCCRECGNRAQRVGGIFLPSYYSKDDISKNTYRAAAFRHYGTKCKRCSYKKDERMLHVHHKDEDRGNNQIENLVVLCVWCHALKTYGVKEHDRLTKGL